MSNIVVVQPITPSITVTENTSQLNVTSSGPQGATGAMGLVPVFSRQNEISTVVGNTRFYFDSTRIISQIRASLGTAPTGSGATFDTLINGVSIGTVTIPANSNTAILTLSKTVYANDYATVSILSVGSTITGSDLTLVLTIN